MCVVPIAAAERREVRRQEAACKEAVRQEAAREKQDRNMIDLCAAPTPTSPPAADTDNPGPSAAPTPTSPPTTFDGAFLVLFLALVLLSNAEALGLSAWTVASCCWLVVLFAALCSWLLLAGCYLLLAGWLVGWLAASVLAVLRNLCAAAPTPTSPPAADTDNPSPSAAPTSTRSANHRSRRRRNRPRSRRGRRREHPRDSTIVVGLAACLKHTWLPVHRVACWRCDVLPFLVLSRQQTCISPLVQIFVETLSGKIASLRVNKSCIIGHIEFLILRMWGVQPGQLRFICGTKQLDNRRRLSDYGIKSRSTLNMVISMRGGGKTDSKRKVRCRRTRTCTLFSFRLRVHTPTWKTSATNLHHLSPAETHYLSDPMQCRQITTRPPPNARSAATRPPPR
jgi:hypothetical protein